MVSRPRIVAIVGAGLAGAVAARILHQAGLAVRVYDKGRGVGGRMATRRVADGPARGVIFDHGAQYVTARDPAFVDAIQRWGAAGVVSPWAEPDWFVGQPGMTALPRALLEGLPVTTGCTVARLVQDEAGWRLHDGDDRPIGDGHLFDAVLVSCPAPQSAALLATAGLAWPALDAVRYAACWALLLAHAGPPWFAEPYRRTNDPDAAIAWMGRDATKPGRNGTFETLVVHAASDWSRRHLEEGPAQVECRLREEVTRSLGLTTRDGDMIRHATAHRWRYSLVTRAAGEPCLWASERGLGVCGDGLLGGRVEAAYLSGAALAARVKESWL
jgi:renalase